MNPYKLLHKRSYFEKNPFNKTKYSSSKQNQIIGDKTYLFPLSFMAYRMIKINKRSKQYHLEKIHLKVKFLVGVT